MTLSLPSRRSASAAISRAWSATSVEDWVETRNSRGSARMDRVHEHRRVDRVGERERRRRARPALPSQRSAPVPDRLQPDAGQQDQRQQRVQHEPGELLARPRVDGEREHERPDEEQPQQRRAAERRRRRPDRAEQQHGPLVGEQHDRVEAGRLAAAAHVVLAEPVVQPRVEPVEPARVRQEGREQQREDAQERGDAPRVRLPAERRAACARPAPRASRASATARRSRPGRSCLPRRP